MLGSVECPFETQFEETAVMELNRGAPHFVHTLQCAVMLMSIAAKHFLMQAAGLIQG